MRHGVAIKKTVRKWLEVGENYQEFNFTKVTFEITCRHPNGDVTEVVGDHLEFRKEVWIGDTDLGGITLYVVFKETK